MVKIYFEKNVITLKNVLVVLTMSRHVQFTFNIVQNRIKVTGMI